MEQIRDNKVRSEKRWIDDNEDDELACLRKEMKPRETESQEADETNQKA